MIKVRTITKTDDKVKLAKLLYQVDDYIYPDFCPGDYDGCIKVLSNLIGNCNFYDYNNFNIIEDGSEPLGILVTFNAPIIANKSEFILAYNAAGIKVSDKFDEIFDNYYKGYEDFESGIVITSLSIDKQHRGHGYGYELLNNCLDADKTYILDVIKDNVSAVKLYKKCGFKVIKERMEYGNQLCYIMQRKC